MKTILFACLLAAAACDSKVAPTAAIKAATRTGSCRRTTRSMTS
ncbi:MAG TPA: hypothetical protein VN253_16595 [Kofleriaceae bacterium]|nr:hypothetical protein [Kofleriaceae bacterium]